MESLSDFEWEQNMLGAEEISVDDEIKGTGEIFMSKHTAKTEDEINKFCSKDGLDEIDRIGYLLRNGISMQKCFVLQNFGFLSRSDLRDGLRDRIIPICLEIILTESIPFQIKLGETLLGIIPTLSPVQALAIFSVAKGLTAHKVEELAKIWREVYLTCVAKIPDDEIKKEVLPEAAIDGGLSQPVNQRIWGARVLGAAACRLDSKKVEQQIFPKASQLSQDTDYEVRKAMCKELVIIMKHVGLRMAKKAILGDFIDLLNDEEVSVQESALENLMILSDSMDAEGRIAILIPIWKKICSDPNIKVAAKAAELFGQFFWKARSEINETDKQIFISYYQLTSSSTDVNIRRICIFNYPAILNGIKAQNMGQYKLDKTLKAFAADEDEQIQLTLATCFHELAIMLAGSSHKYLAEILMTMLNSDSEPILCAIYSNLGDILLNFNIGGDSSTNPNPKQASFMENVYSAIIETKKIFEDAPNIGWRLHEQVIRAYEVFPLLFDPELIFDHCVQSFFKMLSNPYPNTIKKAAIRVLVTFLRRLKKNEHHEVILRQLLDIKDDKSYHIRMLYFDICEEVIIQFSQKFFRSYMFYGYLGLSRDLVPNVRIRFVSTLPLIRHCLRVPTDNLLLSKLIDATEALAVRDSDGGVMLAMNQFHAKHGLLHSPDCCQKSKITVADDFGLESGQKRDGVKKSTSMASLTDGYLIEQLSWESLATGEEDRLKEEAEHQKLYFQLDPAKKKDTVAPKSAREKREFKRSSSTTAPAITRKATENLPDRRLSLASNPARSASFSNGKKDETTILPPLPLPLIKDISILSVSPENPIAETISRKTTSSKPNTASSSREPPTQSKATPSTANVKRQAKSATASLKFPPAK